MVKKIVLQQNFVCLVSSPPRVMTSFMNSPFWQPPQLFKLNISMFQATRIKTLKRIVSKRQTHPHTRHCPVGNKGLPDKKLAGPRRVSISPRIFGPPPLFLILVLGNGESYFIFLLELDFGAPSYSPITLLCIIKWYPAIVSSDAWKIYFQEFDILPLPTLHHQY